MQIHISPADGVPIYLQIVNQVKYLISAGRLAPDEELPPIRVLAEKLLVNPNTVARAYRELEQAGMVIKRRTTGTYVSNAGLRMGRRDRLKIVTQRVDALVAEARQMDISLDEVIEIVRATGSTLANQFSVRKRIMVARTGSVETLGLDNVPSGGESIVEINHVSRSFGAKLALDDVSFRVPSGSVVGLVGENGAGKTTLIKHILGLLKAQTGTVRVFERDPVADPVGVLSRIGYLSEEPDMPGWMRIHELLRYIAAFYPSWDHDYAEQLRKEFDLDPQAKIKQLSKGQRARAGLIIALAYRPELLLLDEPSSGLDPIVRRDILGAIIRTIADEGRTVLFSSHLLTEVERVSDQVAMIKSGRILFCDSMDSIKQSHARLTLRFENPLAAPPPLAGALSWDGGGYEWTTVCQGPVRQLHTAVEELGARIINQAAVSLDEIFLARSGANGGNIAEES